MTARITVGGLQIATELFNLVEREILPGTGINSGHFWQQFEAILSDLGPVNAALLAKREDLQAQIDNWHRQHRYEPAAYKQFLLDIGYLLPEGEDFTITTDNVDTEITEQAGPQLVVPVKNARFALNAANARWGSLYDALYGTDAIGDDGGAERGSRYNPGRGAKVMAFGRRHLDQAAPLANGSHAEVSAYTVVDGSLLAQRAEGSTGLQNPAQFIGFNGSAATPSAILLQNNGLHIDIQIDKNHTIGSTDKAGVKDLLVEAAVTTIMDCEDSVAAVDAQDKVEVYRNWCGLMRGTLADRFEKGGATVNRTLAADRHYTAADGSKLTLPGRSLLFVRNVGHLMTNPAIVDANGNDVPEGVMDGMITALAAMHDLQGNNNGYSNSRTGSVYIVKPKDARPRGSWPLPVSILRAVSRTALSLARQYPESGHYGRGAPHHRQSEKLYSPPPGTRVVFINTGFLDRTGDEIHTSYAGRTAWCPRPP